MKKKVTLQGNKCGIMIEEPITQKRLRIGERTTTTPIVHGSHPVFYLIPYLIKLAAHRTTKTSERPSSNGVS